MTPTAALKVPLYMVAEAEARLAGSEVHICGLVGFRCRSCLDLAKIMESDSVFQTSQDSN